MDKRPPHPHNLGCKKDAKSAGKDGNQVGYILTVDR